MSGYWVCSIYLFTEKSKDYQICETVNIFRAFSYSFMFSDAEVNRYNLQSLYFHFIITTRLIYDFFIVPILDLTN